MAGAGALLNMIANDVVEGGSRNHYFDEYRNREFTSVEPEQGQTEHDDGLSPIKYNLKFITQSDGSIELVE